MTGTTLFKAPQVYLGHDLLSMAEWLHSLKDVGLSSEHHEMAQNLFRDIVDSFGNPLVKENDLCRTREWHEWVEYVLYLGDLIDGEDGVSEPPPEPPTYDSEKLFESVLNDFRKKKAARREEDEPSFAEFT